MDPIRSFAILMFVQCGMMLLAQDYKSAPTLQVVLDHITAAPMVYGDSVLHPKTDALKEQYAGLTGTVVSWSDEYQPLRVRNYSHGKHNGVWYSADSARTVIGIDSFPIAGEIGKRYTYREDGTIETIFPILPVPKPIFDRIFGGHEFGDHLFFDKFGCLRKKITIHEWGVLETHTAYWNNGHVIYSRVLGGKWEIHEFWCIHGHSLGSLTKDCISGTCDVRGTMFVWSKEYSAYYKVTFNRNRYTLQRSNGGAKMSFRTLEELSLKMKDLDLSDVLWRNEIEFAPLPCRHRH